MKDMTSVLHQSGTLCQRGIYYSDEGRESNQRLRNTENDQRDFDRTSIPKESSFRGRNPKGGEIETLMRIRSMNVIMTKCFHECWCCYQCQRGRLSDN
jgi:hypothetical protein